MVNGIDEYECMIFYTLDNLKLTECNWDRAWWLRIVLAMFSQVPRFLVSVEVDKMV